MVNDIYNELSTNFIEYAVAVNTDRAIPDAKSGIKPVVKRILYGAYDQGFTSNKTHVKCANIVGNVMAKWHPHGDSSIYGALVRLSQPWVMRYPLIDFHGSNGNRDGDPPAAYRYTEARLAKLSEDGMLYGIKKNNVDFIPNYSETDDEPVTLPAIFPNLLCNPNNGIGVAIACDWQPHNLREVAQAIHDYIDGKDPMLIGPDFPTGGLIINKDDIPNIMKTGVGSIKIRGKYTIEDNNIVFYEIPYGIPTEDLMQEIGDACDEEKITGIENIRNESNKKGFRLVIECEKGTNIKRIINQLFKETRLQTSIAYNQVALVDKTPTELNLKECIDIYVNHNKECIIKEANFDKAKTEMRVHIIDGIIKALDDIDNIIDIIKKSTSADVAKIALIAKYSFSEEQAKAILDMKLSKLAKLEKTELENERDELNEFIKTLISIISDPIPELLRRLDSLVKTYGDDRRTEIIQLDDSKTEEEKLIECIEPEKCVVVMTESGYIKRIPTSSFKPQKRKGKGVKTQDDITSDIIRTNTIDNIMIFTNKGKVYRLLVNDIPEGTNTSKGVHVRSLTPMEEDENATVIYSVYRDNACKYVMFATKNGLIKKTELTEYTDVKKKIGIIAISMRENDELADVTLMNEEDLILISKNGKAIRFHSNAITPTGRISSGVKGMSLNPGDEVIAMMPVRNDKDNIAIFSTTGLGKRFIQDDMPIQARGGKGIICHKVSSTSGEVASCTMLEDDDNILIIGDKASICIKATDVPITSRTAVGNIMISKSNIVSVSKC